LEDDDARKLPMRGIEAALTGDGESTAARSSGGDGNGGRKELGFEGE